MHQVTLCELSPEQAECLATHLAERLLCAITDRSDRASDALSRLKSNAHPTPATAGEAMLMLSEDARVLEQFIRGSIPDVGSIEAVKERLKARLRSIFGQLDEASEHLAQAGTVPPLSDYDAFARACRRARDPVSLLNTHLEHACGLHRPARVFDAEAFFLDDSPSPFHTLVRFAKGWPSHPPLGIGSMHCLRARVEQAIDALRAWPGEAAGQTEALLEDAERLGLLRSRTPSRPEHVDALVDAVLDFSGHPETHQNIWSLSPRIGEHFLRPPQAPTLAVQGLAPPKFTAPIDVPVAAEMLRAMVPEHAPAAHAPGGGQGARDPLPLGHALGSVDLLAAIRLQLLIDCTVDPTLRERVISRLIQPLEEALVRLEDAYAHARGPLMILLERMGTMSSASAVATAAENLPQDGPRFQVLISHQIRAAQTLQEIKDVFVSFDVMDEDAMEFRARLESVPAEKALAHFRALGDLDADMEIHFERAAAFTESARAEAAASAKARVAAKARRKHGRVWVPFVCAGVCLAAIPLATTVLEPPMDSSTWILALMGALVFGLLGVGRALAWTWRALRARGKGGDGREAAQAQPDAPPAD